MENMYIRNAKLEDIPRIMEIIDIGRKYMRDCGNNFQWTDGYPTAGQIEREIKMGQFFVWCSRGDEGSDSLGEGRDVKTVETIHGVFSFIIGRDPTYDYIEGGKWLNHEPYGTIHRMASDGTQRGMFTECLEYCRKKVDNIRMDTHEINSHMRSLAEKNGFIECGIIYVADGTPRVAYQLEKGAV